MSKIFVKPMCILLIVVLLSGCNQRRFTREPVLSVSDAPPHGKYSILEIGTGWIPSAINGHGDVIGFGIPTSTNPYIVPHVFLWHNGHLADLGVFGNTRYHSPTLNNQIMDSGFVSMNGNGDVAGSPNSNVPSSTTVQALLYHAGKVTNLTRNGFMGFVVKLLDDNSILGISKPTRNAQERHFFIFREGKLKDLGIIRGDNITVTGATNNRVIIGNLTPQSPDSSYYSVGFVWDHGKLSTLDGLGGQATNATAINSKGNIVGSSELAGDETATYFPNHGAVWASGKVHDLGALDHVGHGNSDAVAINNHNQIVGSSMLNLTDERAVLWDKDNIFDLNTLLANQKGWNVIYSAYGINDQGQIAGCGKMSKDKLVHAFILTPVTKN
jgi:uncharacterized membrane protein